MNNSSAQNSSADNSSADKSSADNSSADKSSADNSSADNSSADNSSANNSSARRACPRPSLTYMTHISANSVLPAARHPVWMLTEDGVRIAGEWSLPTDGPPDAMIIWCHPLPTAGGSMDSHLIRKTAWRLPALANIGVLRFNFRGTGQPNAHSEGAFDSNQGERFDLWAALDEVTRAGMPDPWLVGWSFGTDVILRWGNRDPVVGTVLLSPPGRWSNDADVAGWAGSGRPITALVPELDEFAPPAMVSQRFAAVPEATVIGVPGAKHLWVGQRATRAAIDGIVSAILPERAPLPTTWHGKEYAARSHSI